MPTWEELMAGKTFITDLGAEHHAEIEGEDTIVGRYAVWSPIRGCDRHQVVEVGSDLTKLAQKYHIPRERICSVG